MTARLSDPAFQIQTKWLSCLALVFTTLFYFSPLTSPAQQPNKETKITGLLHSRKIAVGEKGVYAVQVDNGTLDNAPRVIKSPGLNIVFQGQNSNLRIVNGVSSNQTIYYYMVSGESEGSFTIPSITLTVRGKSYSTKPAALVIFKRKAGDLTLDASKPYFLRLTTPKTSLYVNQIVPLELTAFVRGQSSIYEIGAPDLKNENMVIKPFQRNVAQGNLAIDGYEYSTAKIQGAVFPIQPGEQVLQQANLRSRFIDRSTRVGGGLRSLFTQTVTRTLQSNSLTFNVKPLPKEGKPSTFSGAVGQFDMEIKASPLKLQTGDPISVDITVKGTGNFDALSAPVFLIKDSKNWRTYEARKIIDPNEQSDGVLPGKSTFTQIVIPLSDASELPAFEISYFDPETEKYVSRRTMPIPLEITADTRAASSASAVAAGGQSAGISTTAPPSPNFDDILFITKDSPHRRRIQAAIQQRTSFWFSQIVPLLLLLWILGVALLHFAKTKGFGAKKISSGADYRQLRTALDDSPTTRSGYYKKIEECLEAWQGQTKKPLNTQPENVKVGFNALNSRCQWILYGAPDKDRSAPPTTRETTEAVQILDALSQHLTTR